MTTDRQRCPACDSAPSEGEAVLRCSVCAALHHSGCWIEGGGCAVRPKHEGVPEPVAYHVPVPVHESIPGAPRSAKVPGPTPEAPLIGGNIRTQPVGPKAPPKGTPRMANPPNPGHLGGRTQRLPTIYTRPGILRFWCLPVGALLAAMVAFGVIWGIDYLSSDDAPAAVVVQTPTPSSTPTQEASATAPATGTQEPLSTDTPEPADTPLATGISSTFASGDQAVVGGTGGDCLNVRAAAGLEGPAVDCIDDGTAVTIIGGPLSADSFIWWQIETPNSSGWAVEIYLAQP